MTAPSSSTPPTIYSSSPECTAGPDLSGQTVGDFRILRRLGQGGMGQVYLAEQFSLKRKVAVKFLKAELAASSTSLQRFKAEAEAVARVTHANIVQVYAVGEWNGLPYMALEYVEGFNLRDYLARRGPPSVLQAINIMRQVASALQRAGEMGIIHRDIKPDNILLSRKGEVKVADFGLSRCLAPDPQAPALTQSGVALGTPLYMSPEQVEGKLLDPRTDIYSFGVTAYHLLSGNPPFRGQSAFELALQHVQHDPQPLEQLRPDLPPALCAAVRKMMAKKPDERFQTGRELLRELTRIRDSLAAASPAGDSSLGTPTQPVAAATTSPLERPSLTPATLPAPASSVLSPGPRRLPYVAIATLVSILAIGSWLGWRHGRAVILADTSAGRRHIPDEEHSQARKHEKFLLEAITEYPHPQNSNELNLGFGSRIELGILYLEQHRLPDADRFFQEWSASREKAYSVLGRLGHAVVLALQDQPTESNHVLLELLQDPEKPLVQFRGLLNRNPPFVQFVVEAVNRNAINCEAAHRSFPAQLDVLRRRRPLPGPAAYAPSVSHPPPTSSHP